MLDKTAAQYFQRRDSSNPQSAQKRRYFGFVLNITEALFQMRKQQGVTQQELASRLRTTQSTVARWETPGYTGYSLRKLFDVAEQLGYVPHLRFVRVMPAETLERTFSEWGNLDMISIEIRKRTMNATALHSSQLIKLQEVPHD